jgi:hypothetical protein
MKYLIFLVFTLLFISCSEKKQELPSNILSKEKYISLMVDMYLLEAKFSHANLMDRPSYSKGIEEYEKIFKKHLTNKKQVENSIDYYSHQPKEMKEIQIIILDSLNLRSNK